VVDLAKREEPRDLAVLRRVVVVEVEQFAEADRPYPPMLEGLKRHLVVKRLEEVERFADFR